MHATFTLSTAATRTLGASATLLATLSIAASTAAAQHNHDRPHLHVSDRWKECSFQLDASLTQSAWRQFTREAGVVAYFRPLADARPMGRGNFEVSVHQWQVGIDDHDAAWNDTFVHPDSTHWLFEGSGLKFPGLMVRAGITDRTDAGFYITKNPNANYGFVGGQVQQSIAPATWGNWSAAARASFMMLYGPEDLDHSVYGLDLVASRTFPVFSGRVTLSPYAGVSATMSRSHEKSAVVDLDDETSAGAQGMIGTAARIYNATVSVEYAVAAVPALSFKIGVGR